MAKRKLIDIYAENEDVSIKSFMKKFFINNKLSENNSVKEEKNNECYYF